jgi:hypothetical protein
MTTQANYRWQLRNVYTFLEKSANSRGLIARPQKELAAEFGLPHVHFHRLLHRLIDDGFVRIAGGGRNAKTLQIIEPPAVDLSDPIEPAGPIAEVYYVPKQPRHARLEDDRLLKLFDIYVGDVHAATDHYLTARTAEQRKQNEEEETAEHGDRHTGLDDCT